MNPTIGARVRDLPDRVSDWRAPEAWGMFSLILIEAVVFASLIVSYFHLRVQAPIWPLGGIEPPDLLLPSINTGILLASVLPIAWGQRAIERGESRRLLGALGVGLVMLLTFLAIKIVEYSGYDYDWATNAYGSVVWTMTGLHVAHVTAVVLKTAAIGVLAWRGEFDADNHVAVRSNTVYWCFVAAVWIPLYATMYLSHHFI